MILGNLWIGNHGLTVYREGGVILKTEDEHITNLKVLNATLIHFLCQQL